MKTINFCGFRLVDNEKSPESEKFQMFDSKRIKVGRYCGRLFLITQHNYKETKHIKYRYTLEFDIHPIRFEVEANTLETLENKFRLKLNKCIKNYEDDVEKTYIASKKEVNKFRKIFG